MEVNNILNYFLHLFLFILFLPPKQELRVHHLFIQYKIESTIQNIILTNTYYNLLLNKLMMKDRCV